MPLIIIVIIIVFYAYKLYPISYFLFHFYFIFPERMCLQTKDQARLMLPCVIFTLVAMAAVSITFMGFSGHNPELRLPSLITWGVTAGGVCLYLIYAYCRVYNNSCIRPNVEESGCVEVQPSNQAFCIYCSRNTIGEFETNMTIHLPSYLQVISDQDARDATPLPPPCYEDAISQD